MPLNLWTGAISTGYIWGNEISAAYLWNTRVFPDDAPSNGLLNNLVSYYKCDTNGSFPDAHWNNNWTINGASFTASWKINGAYIFDWVNDYIETSLSSTELWTAWDYSISFWIRADNPGTSTQNIFNDWESGDRSCLIRLNSNNLQFFVWSWTSTLSPSVSKTFTDAASYHHVVCRHTNSTNLIEIILDWDVVGKSTAIYNGIARTSNNNMFIWSRPWGWDYFDWNIDEIAAFNSIVTDEQVSFLYNSWNWLSYNNFTA